MQAAFRSLSSAAVAVVGDTPKAFATIRPDMGEVVAANASKALYAFSPSMPRSSSTGEVTPPP